MAKNYQTLLKGKKKRWELESQTSEHIIWRSLEDSSITVEAHGDLKRENEEGYDWYIFPAENSKGIPNSPEVVPFKKDALKEVEELKKKSISELKEMR